MHGRGLEIIANNTREADAALLGTDAAVVLSVVFLEGALDAAQEQVLPARSRTPPTRARLPRAESSKEVSLRSSSISPACFRRCDSLTPNAREGNKPLRRFVNG